MIMLTTFFYFWFPIGFSIFLLSIVYNVAHAVMDKKQLISKMLTIL